ncbi:MAG: helix-turn-helix domain-containing protein [Chloroflexota bacterium]|nr:helix-turn-helix domain-containing protein [Chloroflexota bacterium]
MSTIRQLRRARGWTQFELALRVGVQPQAIYLWESGRRMPQVPQMRRLGEVFGLCSDEIDLGPPPGPHRPRADRQPGEQAPGRNPAGRAVTRPDGLSAERDQQETEPR